MSRFVLVLKSLYNENGERNEKNILFHINFNRVVFGCKSYSIYYGFAIFIVRINRINNLVDFLFICDSIHACHYS